MYATVDYTLHGDADLVELVRAGIVGAFGPLYERHVTVATRYARSRVWCPAEAEALVSEGFARLLESILAGAGPKSSFRAYLLKTMAHLANTRWRQQARELPTDVPPVDRVALRQMGSESFQDFALEGKLDRVLVALAYERLPKNSQEILWYTEVLAMSPADIASRLKIGSNAVSQRATRARNDLRTAFLAAHLQKVRPQPGCEQTVDKLSSWTRKTLCNRGRKSVEQHFLRCRSCRALADELAMVNESLPRGCPRSSCAGIG